MPRSVVDFRNHILDSGVLDPEGVHHEFVSGMHGRKLDFDLIPDESELFGEWVNVCARRIEDLYEHDDWIKLALMSVANGTNRLVEPVAIELGAHYSTLLTEKISPKEVALTRRSVVRLQSLEPDLVVAIEDVGTSGSTAATAVTSAREHGARRVEALNTWQRREQLEALVGIDAVYHSIIYEPLPTLTPEECQATGYCSWGWEYIERAD